MDEDAARLLVSGQVLVGILRHHPAPLHFQIPGESTCSEVRGGTVTQKNIGKSLVHSHAKEVTLGAHAKAGGDIHVQEIGDDTTPADWCLLIEIVLWFILRHCAVHRRRAKVERRVRLVCPSIEEEKFDSNRGSGYPCSPWITAVAMVSVVYCRSWGHNAGGPYHFYKWELPKA